MVGEWLKEKISGIPHVTFVLLLEGELGAGKTTFTQGLAQGLGITERLLSPTFVFEREYVIPESLYILHHFDLYRANAEMPLRTLGLTELVQNPGSIIIIEWPERLKGTLPDRYMNISFSVAPDGTHDISWETVGEL
jgi:tRNA threonylcarbamoyladenosine biosynthesis protein TsaE